MTWAGTDSYQRGARMHARCWLVGDDDRQLIGWWRRSTTGRWLVDYGDD